MRKGLQKIRIFLNIFNRFTSFFKRFAPFFKRFAPFFERFQSFSNVSTLPVLPSHCILTPQYPFSPQKPTPPPEKYPKKSPFSVILDNSSLNYSPPPGVKTKKAKALKSFRLLDLQNLHSVRKIDPQLEP
jgi:hypothetical protein